jgi:cell division septation protein DedD
VSLSQNPEWAAQLAAQLKADTLPASVLEPTVPEEGYRVVVGPYPTREQAEEVGKKLGRSYFLIRRPPRRP